MKAGCDLFDTNGDGFITTDEFNDASRTRFSFEAIDADGDDRITKEEYITHNEYNTGFDMLDVDKETNELSNLSCGISPVKSSNLLLIKGLPPIISEFDKGVTISQTHVTASIRRKFRGKAVSHYLLSLTLIVGGISSCVCMCQPGHKRLETCCQICETKTDTKCRECGTGSTSAAAAVVASREEDYNLRDSLPEWYVGNIFSERERDFWNDFGNKMTT